MNEELTPLEALKELKSLWIWTKKGLKAFDIIEAALKDYEEMKKPKKIVDSISFEQSMENYVKNNCPSIAKKLKAFEIIKKKGVNVGAMIESWKSFPFKYQHYLGYKDDYSFEILTEEEFDLLKEVLK